jgi:hypothetical protein
MICSRLTGQNQDDDQKCQGMYSKSAWGGDIEPQITARFTKPEDDTGTDPIVSFVIFEWRDIDYIGVQLPNTNEV